MNRETVPGSAGWNWRPRWWVVAFCLLLANGAAMACSVPVFRYALEHWTSDPYEAVLIHNGPIRESSAALVQELRNGYPVSGARPNLTLRMVDLTTGALALDHALLNEWEKAGSSRAPWLIIYPPRSPRSASPLFSGPLDEESVGVLLGSPARKEIVRRLGAGESAVWVLLECGDKPKDDAALQLLEKRLAYLTTVLELPKLDVQDIRNGLVSVPDEGLKLEFSTLRIQRGDPAERAFVPMLLATEADLAQQREPIVFPVFGQARVLYALVGPGIRHETIDRAASFLIGSCSCQVKEQNPGADLLLTVDWKKLLKEQSPGVPDLPKVSDIVSAMPDAVTTTPKTADAKPIVADCCVVMTWVKVHRGLAAAASVILCLLAGWSVARKLRKRPT